MSVKMYSPNGKTEVIAREEKVAELKRKGWTKTPPKKPAKSTTDETKEKAK